MSEQDIINARLLLAGFMGWTPIELGSRLVYEKKGVNPVMVAQDEEYNLSFDKLMPVWCKFRDLDFKDDVVLKRKHHLRCEIISTSLTTMDSPSEAFLDLATAVEWYNSVEEDRKKKAAPRVFIIKNIIKKPGTTIVKLYGSKKNAGLPNFGNDFGISITPKNDLYDQAILEQYRAGQIRVHVDPENKSFAAGLHVYDVAISAGDFRYTVHPVRGLQTAIIGEVEVDFQVDPDLELEIETTNSSETKVTIWPRPTHSQRTNNML